MESNLLDRLLRIRNATVKFDGQERKYKLVLLSETDMSKDAISGTPFRAFESVPQGRESKRKQNDSLFFDPFRDTLFDYPLIVGNTISDGKYLLKDFNWHLTLQIPFCGMNCWHCYNYKGVCQAGLDDVLEITGSTEEWTAEKILDTFAECRKHGKNLNREYNVLRVSGGEPFLVPDLLAELLFLIDRNAHLPEGKKKTNYPLAIWTETNLLTWAETDAGNSVVKEACKTRENDTLNIPSILQQHYKKLFIHPCFHGLTDNNLQQCTGTKGISFKDLECGFRRLHQFMSETIQNGKTPNIYPTFIAEACDPEGVQNLFNLLYNVNHTYPLKTAVISTDEYGPIQERMIARKKTEDGIRCYSRYSNLKRWNDFIFENYGVAYGQVQRPMADIIASASKNQQELNNETRTDPYEPVLILLKSTYRAEYRQELLSILASPPGICISSTYDTRHVDPSALICLKAGTKGFDDNPLKVLVVYGDPDSKTDLGRYLPIRWGILTDIHITDRLVNLKFKLDKYAALKASNGYDERDALEFFSISMRNFFGKSTLLERPFIRWLLLGEQEYLLSYNLSRSKDEELAWDNLLSAVQKLGFPKFSDKSIFLQILKEKETNNTNHTQDQSNEKALLEEGGRLNFKIRYYINSFDVYDRDPSLNDGRTIKVTSTDKSLRVENYEEKVLAKYGELPFSVVCDELSHSRDAIIAIESKSGSPYCPRVEVPFLLKKATPSDG